MTIPYTDPFRPDRHPSDHADRFRVLVVDDNEDLAQLFSLLLEHCGFNVRTVLDGYLVLSAARSFLPHFITLDIGLPGLDGYQLAEQIRDDPALKAVVIIAISAYGPDSHPERFRRAGFDHHLTKPVDIDDLLPLLVPRRG